MANLNDFMAFAIEMISVGSVAGVGALTIGALSTASADAEAQTILGYGGTSLSNFTSQLGTTGTVLGVMALLGLVMGLTAGAGRGI